MSYLFLVLFLLHTPSLYFNLHGVDGASNSDTAILVKTTLGNQYANPINITTNGTTPAINSNTVAGIDKKDVGVICTTLDTVSTIVFLLFFLITAAMNSRDADAYYASILTVSRYSVAVNKLPQRHIDRTEIRHFFSQFGAVVDVSILSSNFKLVELYCQRAHTRKQLSLAEQDADHTNLSSCREKLAAVDAAIVEEREQHISKPVAAFVTFEKQEDSDACIAAYGDSWWFTLFMPSHLRLQRPSHQRSASAGTVQHSISQPQLQQNEQELPRLGSFIATVTMLSITTAIVYIAQYVHNNKIPQVNECDGSNSPPAFYHESDPASWSLSVRDCWCSSLSFADLISNRALCDDYIQSYALNTSLVVLTALTTVIINTAIQIVTMYISAVEKHSSRSSAQKGMAKKIAIGLTLNTGIIIFLVNLDLSWFWDAAGIGFFSSAGGFTDLTRDWFVTVGTSLLITMMIGIFNPSLFSVAMVLYDRCRRNMFTGIKSNQDELNQLFRGRQMTLDQRYAVTTATLYVCYMYAGGMPILLLIAAFTFGLTYWCDRYAFIHAYRIPPRYSESLDELALRWLPPAAVLHLIMSCWFFSSPLTDSYRVSTGAAEDNWLTSVGWLPFNIADRIVQWNVLPLFVLLMLIIAQFAFRGLFTALSTLFICRHCCNSSTDRLSRILPAYFDFGIAVGVRPTYFEACSRVRMESYRLSKQPHWRIAYMITASNHQLAAENDFDDVAPILATIRQPNANGATNSGGHRQSLWASERVECDGDNGEGARRARAVRLMTTTRCTIPQKTRTPLTKHPTMPRSNRR